MTIRAYLKRRSTMFLSLVLLTAVAMMICGFLLTRRIIPPDTAWLVIALFAASLIPTLFFFRCPRCTANLGSLVAHFGPLAFMARKPVRFCPFCGVDVDHDLEPKT